MTTHRAPMELRFLLLQLCFFVSGFAALLYETVWTRELAFVFGTSQLAISAVLAAYMAGLASGAAVAARLAPRLRRPVLAYGLLELGIALGALLVPFGIRAVMSVYLSWLGGLQAPPETLGLATALFHLAGAFVVLVPCTALMGATLPLLARHAVRSDEQIGPRIGLLYGVNTAGAITGTIVAAFVLLPEVGLRKTVYVGAAANFIVFAAAALLARHAPARDRPSDTAGRRRHTPQSWILPLIAISGAISFVYEVLWTRLLGYVLGASTAAFASMLASFLLGIALGSALAARLARRRQAAAVGFALAQLGTALTAWGAFGLADRLPEIAAAMGASPEHLAPGALAAILVLLPFTLCIGATFPFAVRIFAAHAEEAAPASARVYAWNTVGSAVGAVAAGFWLLPWLGFGGTLLAGVLGNLALAGAATFLLLPRGRRRGPLLAAVALCGVLLVSPPGTPLELLRLSALTGRTAAGEIEYMGVGRSGTVMLLDTGRHWRIFSNGLPESAISRPEIPHDRFQSAPWLALLPALVRPDIRDMLMIGLGGGGTLAAITPGLRSLDLIELEPEVVEANSRVASRRRDGDPMADPRITLYLGDARGALMLADSQYDAVVSQPSHPWTSGASHLYTREFFQMIRARLRPNGVFVQWIGLAFVDVDLLRGLLATLRDVFPHVEVYRPEPTALLFAASGEPIDTLSTAERVIASAPIQFGRVGVHGAEDVALVRVLDAEGTRALAEGAFSITDDHNRLASAAGRLGDASTRRGQIDALLASHDPLPQRIAELDVAKLIRQLVARGDLARGKRLLPALSEARQNTARGWAQYEAGQSSRARESFQAALDANPRSQASRIGLACLSPRAPREANLGKLPSGVSAVADGLDRHAAADWQGLQELDGELAQWRPADLLFPEAARLRAAWRIASGETSAGEQALQIIDVLLTRRVAPIDYLTRAEAAHLAGRSAHAWVALERFVEILPRHRSARELTPRALGIARKLEPDSSSDATLKLLEQAARRS